MKNILTYGLAALIGCATIPVKPIVVIPVIEKVEELPKYNVTLNVTLRVQPDKKRYPINAYFISHSAELTVKVTNCLDQETPVALVYARPGIVNLSAWPSKKGYDVGEFEAGNIEISVYSLDSLNQYGTLSGKSLASQKLILERGKKFDLEFKICDDIKLSHSNSPVMR
jgi:hypothetical protein